MPAATSTLRAAWTDFGRRFGEGRVPAAAAGNSAAALRDRLGDLAEGASFEALALARVLRSFRCGSLI